MKTTKKNLHKWLRWAGGGVVRWWWGCGEDILLPGCCGEDIAETGGGGAEEGGGGGGCGEGTDVAGEYGLPTLGKEDMLVGLE